MPIHRRPWTRAAAALVSGMLLFSLDARAQSRRSAPVTQEQYRRTLEILRRTVEKTQELEKELRAVKRQGGGSASGSGDGMVDLSKMGSTGPRTNHRSSGIAPQFKFYFDLNTVYRPGFNESTPTRADFTFANYHGLTMVEMLPDSKLQFSFELSTAPRYYELDYQVTERVQLRVGRIWIPFDDLSPHNIFGGRVNVSTLLHPGARTQFLPDIWADLGIGAKFQLAETRALSAHAHVYIVNGFGQGNAPAFTETDGGSIYPNFGSTASSNVPAGLGDNNNDKSVGARVHGLLLNRNLGIGASIFRGRYSDQQNAGAGILMGGLDGQFRFRELEFRVGIASMKVDTPDAELEPYRSFTRNGTYAEAGYKFGPRDSWKLLFRTGNQQLDSRITDDLTDMSVAGATLLWRPGPIEYSLHFSKDLQENIQKTNTTYIVGRVIIAL